MSFIVDFPRPVNFQGPYNITIEQNINQRYEFKECRVLLLGTATGGGTRVEFPNEETFTLFMFSFDSDMLGCGDEIELNPIRIS